MTLWVIAVALGVQALLGFSPFPISDDYIFGPLAEAWADPGHYPRDDLLNGFSNHAWAYTAVYWLAKSTIGVAAGFWVAVLALSIASVMAMRAVMVRVGATGIALPLAIAIGVLVIVPGVGRGISSGFMGSFFQGPWIALALVMWAFVAVLGGRAVLAGLALGAAVYAQPMSALHGALAITVASATQGRAGLRGLSVTGAVTMLVALPYEIFVILPVLTQPAAPVPDARLVEEVYLFFSPHRYQPAAPDLWLGWGYLALGLVSAAILHKLRSGGARPAGARTPGLMVMGLIGGLGALHGVSTLLYFDSDIRFLPLYILDATRSSPLFFVLSATLFAAAIEKRAETGLTEVGGLTVAGLAAAGWRPLAMIGLAGAIGLTLMALNTTPQGWFFAFAGALLISAPGRVVPKVALAVMLSAVFGLTAYKVNLRPLIDRQHLELFDWAAGETRRDALFIVPPRMHGFRLLAQRSIYADFKLASLAQPGVAWAARARLEQIARPGPIALAARGREAVRLWDRAYTRAATCAGMVRMMREAGAGYFVRPIAARSSEAGSQPDCRGAPKIAFANATLTVYSVIHDRKGALE